MDLTTVIAIFNILVGLMLVMSILMLMGGLGTWYVRLGTSPTYRDEAIKMMQWGVATLFVLVASPFMIFGGGILHLVGFLFALAALVMQAIALPGLFKRAKSSWNMLFYASVVSMIGNVVSLNLVGVILGAVIGWYILFQVKALYKV